MNASRENDNLRKARIAEHYLEQLLPEEKKQIVWEVSLKNQIIYVGKEQFHYEVEIRQNVAHVLLFHRVIKDGSIYWTYMSQKDIKLGKRNIRTKHGVSNKSIRNILFAMAAVGVLAVPVYQSILKDDPQVSKENVLPMEEMPEDVTELVETLEIPEEIHENFLNVQFDMTDEGGYQKRAETELEYGDLIQKYTDKYGLDYLLMVCQLTFERSNNPKDPLEVRQNVGQLTRAICGEVIMAPVYEDGIVVGKEKIIVLPPETSEKYSDIKEQASTLQEKDHTIEIVPWDTIYEKETNIRVSTMYLSYILNSKKKDLVRSVMGYNAGYGSVKDDYSYDYILNGGIDVDDPYYWKHILQYLYPDEYKEGFQVYINGEPYHYQVVPQEKKLEESYDEENGYHL